MTRIETALRAMLEDVEYIDDMSDPLRVEGRMLATPTGQALAALAEAAEALYDDGRHPWTGNEARVREAFADFRAATEPAGGDR